MALKILAGGILKRWSLKKAFIMALFAIAALSTLPKWNLLPMWQRDFVNIWLSGRALGSGINPYDIQAFYGFAQGYFPDVSLRQVNFTYPPHAILLFAPFSLLPPTVSLVAWDIASLALFYWAARPLMPEGMPTILALLTPAGLICLIYGQTGLISAALFLIAFRPNGLSAALLTFKPHMGFLVIPALARSRVALWTAIILTIALMMASAILLPSGWLDFARHAGVFQGGKLTGGTGQAWLFKGTTPMIGYGVWGWLLYAAGAVYLLARNFNIFTAATATFLISPYGFHYDMAAVSLGFAILLYSHWEVMPVWHKAVASLAFLAPLIVDAGTWLVPPILLLGLLVQGEWFDGSPIRFVGAAAPQKMGDAQDA